MRQERCCTDLTEVIFSCMQVTLYHIDSSLKPVDWHKHLHNLHITGSQSTTNMSVTLSVNAVY